MEFKGKLSLYIFLLFNFVFFSKILCLNLTSGEVLYKLDIGSHLMMMSNLVCQGHSQIHLLDDFIILSLIKEVKYPNSFIFKVELA